MSLPWIERPNLILSARKPVTKRFRDVPPHAVRDGRRVLDRLISEIPAEARQVAKLVRVRTANRFHAEAKALAAMVDAEWEDLYVANLSYDLHLAAFGCSTIALATAEGPVIARNMDWPPEDLLAQTSHLVRLENNGKLIFANAGWPGAIGVVTGLSGRGFAITLNAVLSDEGANMRGYPVLLHLRRVLEDASDFNDALHRLETQKLALSALITLVGTKNPERVVIERTPTRVALRWGNPNEPLIATNDYRALDAVQVSHQSPHPETGEIYETACHRFDSLERFFLKHQDDHTVTDDQLLYALTDDNVIQGITAQHIVMRPAQQQIRLFAPRHLVEAAP